MKKILFLLPVIFLTLGGICFAQSGVDLKNKYDSGQKIKILVVPGHDNETIGGTQFRGVKEADLNLMVGTDLFELLSSDSRFETLITRDKNGYKPEFANYFSQNQLGIISFRDQLKAAMSNLLDQGLVQKNVIMEHNFVSQEDSIKLYGINKWANDNNVDVVIHAHFNDYPERPWNAVGKYSGFSVYIPEKQLPNYKSSFEMAGSVFNQLKKYLAVSDHPIEKIGIVEDQQLIATGSNDSLNSSAMLIEYGYIYESQFRDGPVQPLIMKELAYQTYQGVEDYFASSTSIVSDRASILPHQWKETLDKGLKNNSDVLALQVALSKEGLYPPAGTDKNECTLSGNFGSCTSSAILAFQKKYNIPLTGSVGPMTMKKLNFLYSFSESPAEFSYSWKKDLSYGMENNIDVRALQIALKLEGIYSGPITGNFYEMTREAVLEFQKNNNFTSIPKAGIVGPHTRQVLTEIYSKSSAQKN